MVAKTILQQLKQLGQVQMWSWGTHAIKSVSDEHLIEDFGNHLGALVFKVQGRLFKGHVAVVLMPNDTYTVHLGSLRQGRFNSKQKFENIYFDMLVDTIDSAVETP